MENWFVCSTCEFLFPGHVDLGALVRNCEHPCVIERVDVARAVVQEALRSVAKHRGQSRSAA